MYSFIPLRFLGSLGDLINPRLLSCCFDVVYNSGLFHGMREN